MPGLVMLHPMIRNVICGVWELFYTSCFVVTLHSTLNAVMIAVGRSEKPVLPVRYVSVDLRLFINK